MLVEQRKCELRDLETGEIIRLPSYVFAALRRFIGAPRGTGRVTLHISTGGVASAEVTEVLK